MRNILEIADNDILVTDYQGNILYANTTFFEKYPEIRECFKEKNIRDICSAETGEVDVLEFVKENIEKECVLLNKRNSVATVVRIAKELWEGQPAYFYMFNRNCFVAHEESRMILNQVLYAVWGVDTEGRYCFVNKAFMKQVADEMGYDEKQSVIGKKVEDIWDKPMCEVVKKAEQVVLQTKSTYVFEVQLERKGKKRWYRFKLTPIQDKEGEVKYICGICEENTYYKYLETAITQSYLVSEQYVSGEVELNEMSAIIEDVRHRLQADGLYIGMVKEDTLFITGKAGVAVEEFKDTNIMQGARKWAEYISKRWGLFEGKDIWPFIQNKNLEAFFTKYEYYFYYPINLGSKVIAFITAYYIDKKPEVNEHMLWLPRLCEQLSMLMRNKILAHTIGDSINKMRIRENELNTIINTAAYLIVIINREGIITQVNKCWEEQLGWKQEEMIGKKLTKFFYSEDKSRLIKEAKMCEEAKKKGIVRIICSDATLKWYEWHMKSNVETDRTIFTATDITDQVIKKSEQDEREVKEIENLKDGFLVNMSHEFRTPVNVILSAVQLLGIMQEQKGGLKPEDFEIYSNKIKHNGYRLLRLTNNLIALSQLNLNVESVNFVNTNIVSLVEHIVKGVRACIDKQKVEIRFITNISEEIIACDIEKIEKIVLNLISNSIKYAKLDIKANIEVSVISEEEEICIGVRDNGIGISKEKLNVIFAPFVQVNEILNKPAEGSGIGLALTKKYTEVHNGRIGVESDEGIGSKFSIFLPIATLEEGEVKYGDFRSIVEQCRIELSDIS